MSRLNYLFFDERCERNRSIAVEEDCMSNMKFVMILDKLLFTSSSTMDRIQQRQRPRTGREIGTKRVQRIKYVILSLTFEESSTYLMLTPFSWILGIVTRSHHTTFTTLPPIKFTSTCVFFCFRPRRLIAYKIKIKWI